MNTTELASTPKVDKSGDKVRSMFAQIATRYDLLNHVLSLGIDIRWRKKVVARLPLNGDLPILDCCTGTGDLALLLANKVKGRGVEVIGSDFCPEMLEVARRKHQSKYPDLPVRFVEADAQQLPFPDNHFQAVTVAFGLRNVQDTDRGLSELIRVCAPGGQVAVLEFSKATAPGLKQLYQFYFTHLLPRIGQGMAKNDHSAYSYLPNSVLQFPSGQAMADKMKQSGLHDVAFYPYTFGIATLYLGTK
jgi:demethylmenaquinone methyltransferase/2-methoxy-6-polyprenyl-1,4-benzoquinol methylase